MYTRPFNGLSILLLLLVSLHIQKTYSAEIDIISDSRFLTEGDTLVSPAGIFELGFFRPEGSENRYVGIWYKKISVRRVVWVLNRDLPLTGASSATLKIVDPGTLVLMNGTDDVVWSSNTTSSANPIAQLDDNGNLVVRDGIDEEILWQSFDYPTDTHLPGMKFGKIFLTGKEWSLSSWKTSQDPAPGDFTWSVDTRSYPQSLLEQGSDIIYRGKPWNGLQVGEGFYKNISTTNIVINETEVTYTYHLLNSSVESIITLNSFGRLERWVWIADENKWQLILQLPKDLCDRYSICGTYATCDIRTAQRCVCLDETRFGPSKRRDWEIADWTNGCVRRTSLDCESGFGDSRMERFIKYSNLDLPDTHTTWFDNSMTLEECEAECLADCSCTAYANTDILGKGSGCLLWFYDLNDIRVSHGNIDGQDIFVKMASLDRTAAQPFRGPNIKIILPVVIVGVLLIGLSTTWLIRNAWRKRHHAQPTRECESLHVSESGMELPLFSFSTIVKATANFSPENKLGEGGFGPVYKGILEEGKEVAVKRLSKTSSQGVDEFKNEVICISKLQHRNLVKLLGCCIQGDEKLLIYEYMPNRSLDSFIFDRTQNMLLDWTKRFNIIKGIARGLLYLHQDSRLRIVHRDLKASNILLDLDMNPKISDFGIARSFGGNQTEANTERVVGTYGYMSPEYALDGLFSIKSDVFSFGVLALEIVSGEKNRGFIHPDHDNNLIGHVWSLYNEERSMEVVDTSLAESCHPSEVLRSIKVGLLCVQQNAGDRPNMSSVIVMLDGEGAMPQPKQPAFFMERELFVADFSSSTYPAGSINDLTVTDVDAR